MEDYAKIRINTIKWCMYFENYIHERSQDITNEAIYTLTKFWSNMK